MPDLLISARDVSRVYKSQGTESVAISAASCRVMAGDRIALVGPSGSGKTTLLHLLAGLDEPTAGTIEWPGLGERSALRPTKVALVFQSPSLLAPLNVQENVAVPLLLGGVDEDQAHAAARAALERIGIGQLAHKLPEELSAGQAQRVAMARALASKPRIIFADEPTGQLDHPTAQQLLASMFAALDDQISVVVATHDREVAARLAQQWHMSHGKLTAP